MFGRRGRRASGSDDQGSGQHRPQQPPESELDRWLSQADARAATDPLAYAALMGTRLASLTVTEFAGDHRLDPVTTVTVLGSMSGFAAQVATVLGQRNGDPEFAGRSTMVVDGANGDRMLMGDAINWPLFSAPYSVWNILTTSVRMAGGAAPGIEDVAGHGARTAGTPAFATPRFDPGTVSLWMPTEALERCGKVLAIQLNRRLPPERWYWAYAMAAKIVLDGHRHDPALPSLTRVALDSANAMAKLMPARQTA